jgi:hypothetical protein
MEAWLFLKRPVGGSGTKRRAVARTLHSLAEVIRKKKIPRRSVDRLYNTSFHTIQTGSLPFNSTLTARSGQETLLVPIRRVSSVNFSFSTRRTGTYTVKYLSISTVKWHCPLRPIPIPWPWRTNALNVCIPCGGGVSRGRLD